MATDAGDGQCWCARACGPFVSCTAPLSSGNIVSAGDYIVATHLTNSSAPSSDATVLLRSGGVYVHPSPCELLIEVQPMLGATVVTALAITSSAYLEVHPFPLCCLGPFFCR